MKYIFMIVFVVLVASSIATYMSMPNIREDVPVLHWVTDNNPARKLQVERFHQWLIDNNHVTAEGKPKLKIKLDTGNRDISKIIIQTVSGVGGDIIDVSGGRTLQQFQAMGILEDITEDAKVMGFSPDKTWASMKSEITVNDLATGKARQYTFPCNVGVGVMWANLATFKKYNVEVPTTRWTLDDFERIGKKLVKAASTTKQAGKVYITAAVNPASIYQSMGVSNLNETLTASTLADPRIIEANNLIQKWRDIDKIIPTKADLESFDTQAGYSGAAMQLFNRGNFATLSIGRYGLIQMRRFGSMQVKVLEPPHSSFPVTACSTRAAAIYKGGKNKDLAKLFLAFLASESYNQTIVEDADAMPPNPAFTRSEAFTKPTAYPNEWGAHQAIADILNNIAIPVPMSPYVLAAITIRIERKAVEKIDNHLGDTKTLLTLAQEEINTEIARNLIEYPKLKSIYDKDVLLQKKIDRYRADNKPVPLSWIKNPFYKRYYLAKGWAKGDE